MRKIAVDQLQRLQRVSANDDVIRNDVTSARQVGDDRRCAEYGDERATNEPPQ